MGEVIAVLRKPLAENGDGQLRSKLKQAITSANIYYCSRKWSHFRTLEKAKARLIAQNIGDHPPRSGNALGEGKAAIQQQTANLADDGSAVVDHSLSGTMQGLDILLLDALLGDEGDMRLARGRADGFRVVAVRSSAAAQRASHIAG